MPDRYRIVILPEAGANIDAIFGYVEQHSLQNATRVAATILKAIDSLEILPRRHKVHSSSRDPRRVVRSMPVPPYLIYYRVVESDKVVEVMTVRDGRRRQPRRFK